MKLILPKDVDDIDRQPIPQSAIITIIPAKNDLIYYYEGDDCTKIKTANYQSIRDIILGKKRYADPKWFEVVLKPTKEASYKNVVNILDEMKIDAVPRYALVDISPDEYRITRSQ